MAAPGTGTDESLDKWRDEVDETLQEHGERHDESDGAIERLSKLMKTIDRKLDAIIRHQGVPFDG